MSKIIQTDLDALTKEGFQRISLGVKPSGSIHLGTSLTFLNGILALQVTPNSTLDTTIMDLDFDFQRGLDFPSLYKKQDDDSCHTYLKDHVAEEASVTLREMARHFNVNPSRIKIAQFSGITQKLNFQKHLGYLFGTEEGKQLLRKTVVAGKNKTDGLVSPICESCYHSSTHAPYHHKTQENKITLVTKCYNPDCFVEKYEVGLTEPGKVNLFYLIDPIRDLTLSRENKQVDIHIFGGDYGAPYGGEDLPKSHRVFGLMQGLSNSPPTVYVGPMLTNYGVKIGKSQRNGFAIADTKKKFPNWIDRLHSLLTENKNEKVIDLANGNYFS